MSTFKRVTILPVTERGVRIALQVGTLFSEPKTFAPSDLKSGGLKRVVQDVWPLSDAVIFICASGIAVRMIAPLLRSKATDPAVLVLDETGRFVISLVSGHLGGANELTGRVAHVIGAVPVITTATDSHGLPCIEEIAGEFGLVIDNLKKIKLVNSAILDGGPVSIVDTDTRRQNSMKEYVAAFGKKAVSIFSFVSSLVSEESVRAYVYITPLAKVEVFNDKQRTLFLRPCKYVAGIGCRRGVSAGEIREAVAVAMERAGLSLSALKRVATIDIKSDEVGLLEFAESAGVELHFYSADELNSVEAKSGSSPVVLRATGARAVAEPAALISAKTEKLCLEKIKTERVTVALAEIQEPSL